MMIMSTYSYDEFHPFLFAQHAKSYYLEFDTFDKVNSEMTAYFGTLFKTDFRYFSNSNVNLHFWSNVHSNNPLT